MWTKAWNLYRQVTALQGLLDLIGVWKYISIGGAFVIAIALATWSYILGLSGPVLTVIFLAGLTVTLTLFGRVRRQFRTWQESENADWQIPRSAKIVGPMVLGIAGIGLFVALREEQGVSPVARVTVPSPQAQSNESKTNPALTKQKPERKQTAEEAHSKIAPPIVVAPGGVVSVGQQGGITAGQVTITNPPAKKLSLTDEQQKLVSSVLNKFEGQRVLIEVKNLTGETHAFGKALQAALTAAKITAELDESLSRFGGCQASPGISFTAGTRRMPLANALASALLEAGVTDSPIPTCGRAGEPDEFIVMLLPL